MGWFYSDLSNYLSGNSAHDSPVPISNHAEYGVIYCSNLLCSVQQTNRTHGPFTNCILCQIKVSGLHHEKSNGKFLYRVTSFVLLQLVGHHLWTENHPTGFYHFEVRTKWPSFSVIHFKCILVNENCYRSLNISLNLTEQQHLTREAASTICCSEGDIFLISQGLHVVACQINGDLIDFLIARTG